MARLNLEDEFFIDPTLEALAAELGLNKYEVRGRLASLFHMAISELCPVVDTKTLALWFGWPLSKAGELASAMLVTDWISPERPDKVSDWEIRGVRKNMRWLAKKQAAGQKGGAKRWHPDGTSTENDSTSIAQPPKPIAPACPPTPTPTHYIYKGEAPEEPEQPKFDLHALFMKYPNPVGMDVGLELLRPQIKTQQDYDDFQKAVAIYDRECKKRKRHIKDFNNFVSLNWREWLSFETKKKGALTPPTNIQDPREQSPEQFTMSPEQIRALKKAQGL